MKINYIKIAPRDPSINHDENATNYAKTSVIIYF